MAQCRCVSKLWSSIIRRPNYNMLFPTKSPATPRFLFIVENGFFGLNVFISSSPQPQNPDTYSSLVATFNTRSATNYCSKICHPVNGLVCRQYNDSIKGYTYALISNPITGEYVRHQSRNKAYFGYDPIEKQFKVMFITWLPCGGSHEYQVLTLRTGNLSWRKIQCCTPHNPHEDDGICINDLLYYQAIIDQKHSIVCFDVKSEKFSFVSIDPYLATKIWEPLILINYKGDKLGVIHCDMKNYFHLWVLENAEEHKWSDNFYTMPEVLCPSRLETSMFSARMIGSGKVVLYPKAA